MEQKFAEEFEQFHKQEIDVAKVRLQTRLTFFL